MKEIKVVPVEQVEKIIRTEIETFKKDFVIERSNLEFIIKDLELKNRELALNYRDINREMLRTYNDIVKLDEINEEFNDKIVKLEKELEIYGDNYSNLLCKLYLKENISDIQVKTIEGCITKIKELEEENNSLKEEKDIVEDKYKTLKFILNFNYGISGKRGGRNKWKLF